MTGGTATAQIVVIECRQIVMNQRIGVNHFECTGTGFDAYRRIGNRLGCRDGQQRTNAFPARKKAITHRAMDGGGVLVFARYPTIQRGVDGLLFGRHVFGERHALFERNGSGWTSPARFIRISTRVSASSSCLRQASLSFIPRSNSSRARSRGSSPLSISLTMFSNWRSPVSKLMGASFGEGACSGMSRSILANAAEEARDP